MKSKVIPTKIIDLFDISEKPSMKVFEENKNLQVLEKDGLNALAYKDGPYLSGLITEFKNCSIKLLDDKHAIIMYAPGEELLINIFGDTIVPEGEYQFIDKLNEEYLSVYKSHNFYGFRDALSGTYGILDYEGNLIIPCICNSIKQNENDPNEFILEIFDKEFRFNTQTKSTYYVGTFKEQKLTRKKRDK